LDILYANIPIELIEPVDYDSDEGLLLSHEIGLERINALAAWENGWTGQGRVVMNIDTGVDGTHPALSERFRGDVDGDGDYDESWLDPYDTHWEFPQDGASHGTHTMGTICGRSASGDTIGVAIDAQWIASAAIDRGGGISRTIQDILISFEWAVDPDGDPETQDNPDAIGNSWGIPDGYEWEDCDRTFWIVIDNVEAAGSVVIFSAGNEGTNGLRSPADRAETIYNVFSVGAVNGNDPTLPIASWSARGPSECNPDTLLNKKPEVVAPGVNVRSSVPGGGYSTMSGTSMASPHVTGAAAVMRQLNPNLDVDTIKDILISTAHDLPFHDPDGEDNTYGHGIIDLYEACLLTQAGFGFIEGRVTDIYDSGIGDALIRVIDSEMSTNADEDGYYEIALPGDATYTLEASFFGYLPEQVEVELAIEETTIVDFVLQEAPEGNLHGTVVSADDASPIPGANIELVDTPVEPSQTDDNGFYEFVALPGDATYIIRVRASGFGMGEDSIFVPGEGDAELNFALGSFESFENDDGNWVGEDLWEWGEPTSGPGMAFDGFNVWATVLDGEYVNNADELLISNFIAVDDDQAILRFYHWYDFELDGTDAWDGGNVSVRILGENLWELINPAGGYPADQIRGLNNEPGYSGSSDDWVEAEFDLGDYEGSILQLGFRIGANSSITREGWYIDSVDVSGATLLPIPDIELDPASFAVEIQSGQSADRTLTIANPTDGVLTFEITPIIIYGRLGFHDDSTPSNVTGRLNRYGDKNYLYSDNGDFLTVTYSGPRHDIQEPDPDPPMILDSGGPDEYGYTWIDSDEPDGPVYEWIEISGDGEPLQFDDDQNQGPFDLGFEIPYYGNYYGSIRICSNGWISFTSNETEYYNRPIPNDNEPNNLVAPLWDNLNPESGGVIYFYTNNTDSAIVEWQDVPRYPGSGSFTFEAILTADGNITYQYNTVDGILNSCTIGIENGDGTVGLQIAHNQYYVAENLAVKIKHPTIWLSADPLSGFVMSGGSSDINVTFDATQLDEGEYVGYLDIISNDPDEGSIAVECTLTVSGPTGLGDLSDVFPEKFELQQNYPNPFNPTTRLTFAIPVQSAVRLTIYDLLGRQVRGLLAEELPAGYHAVSWDGTNDRGRAVSSGIYFYRLEAGDFEQNRKMIMLK
jgi:subtilisin family serine protease